MSLYNICEKYNNIVIFGAALLGKLIYNELKKPCIESGKTICFADNSLKKWNEITFTPTEAFMKYPSAVWIIASDMRPNDLREELLKLGVTEGNIIMEIPEEILAVKREAERNKRINMQSVIELIEFDVCHHCNLNCAGCFVFSPLVKKPVFANLVQFKRDIRRLSALLDGKLGEFRLIGGEPLLNPELQDFMSAARRAFPDIVVRVITNGILLQGIDKAFWNSAAENEIIISITKYPINLDYDAISNTAVSYGVNLEYFGNAVKKNTDWFPFDISGGQNPQESFNNCVLANYCIRLRNGKLSTCCIILVVDFFNNFFDKNLKVTPDDYIDIYKAKSGKEIREFLSKPVPFCRYCDIKSRTYDNVWKLSKREISEWS